MKALSDASQGNWGNVKEFLGRKQEVLKHRLARDLSNYENDEVSSVMDDENQIKLTQDF